MVHDCLNQQLQRPDAPIDRRGHHHYELELPLDAQQNTQEQELDYKNAERNAPLSAVA